MPHLPSNSHFYSSEYLFCFWVCMCACVSQKIFVFLSTSQMIGYLFCILPSYIISLHCFKAKRAKVTQLRTFPQTSSPWHAWGGHGQSLLHSNLLITCSLNQGCRLWPGASDPLSCSLMGAVHLCPSFMWVCNSIVPSQQARGLQPGWFPCY